MPVSETNAAVIAIQVREFIAERTVKERRGEINHLDCVILKALLNDLEQDKNHSERKGENDEAKLGTRSLSASSKGVSRDCASH